MNTSTSSRLAKITNCYWQAVNRLNEYEKPCISEAPEQIARLRGLRDYASMVGEFWVRHYCVLKAATDQPRDAQIEQIRVKLLASNPANYLKQIQEYIGIEVALRLLFGDGGQVRGLQLASNYGPYLHYLKTNQFGSMVGIDNDPLAVRYAQQIGINVIQANAAELPLVGNGFDVVFSHNFIVYDYEQCLLTHRQNAAQFFTQILGEVERVLRPGGVFLSSTEFLDRDQVSRAGLNPHPDFQGEWFDRNETPELKWLQVFEKRTIP